MGVSCKGDRRESFCLSLMAPVLHNMRNSRRRVFLSILHIILPEVSARQRLYICLIVILFNGAAGYNYLLIKPLTDQF